MKSIFESEGKSEIELRLNKLTNQTQAQWGKMNVAQMLAHCALSFQVPVGDLKIKPNPVIRFIGRFFKSLATNDKPFKKNSPTAGEFLITDPRIFDQEKQNFIMSFNKVSVGETSVRCFEHAFFGTMTAAEWGKLMYKHTDHHFKQFGV